MTQLMYEGDPLEIKGLFCVYMAGSVECALRQHPECMNADDCLFHRTDPGCGIERFYWQLAEGETPMMRNVNCRSDQARILVRSLVDCKGDFPEMIFGPPPGNNPDSFWVDLTEDQKNVLRAAYADAFGKLYGGKKIMVVDPGHGEGSRSAAARCVMQAEGAIVIEAVADMMDKVLSQDSTQKDMEEMEQLNYDLGQETQMLYLNSMRAMNDSANRRRGRQLGKTDSKKAFEAFKLSGDGVPMLQEDRSIEIIPADKTARISDTSIEKKSPDYMKDFMELDPDERKRRLFMRSVIGERPDKERNGLSADVIEQDGRIIYKSPIALNPDKHYIIAGGKMPEVPEHFKEKGLGAVSDAQACLPGQPMRDNTEQHNALSEQARVEAETCSEGTVEGIGEHKFIFVGPPGWGKSESEGTNTPYSALGSVLGMAMGGALGAVAGGFPVSASSGPLSLSEKFREHLVEGTYEQGFTHYICERESSKAWKRRMKKERQRIIHRDRMHRELMHRFKRLMEEEALPGMKLMFGKFDPAIIGNPNTPVGLAFTSKYGIIDDLDRTTGRLWMEFIKGVLLSE